MSRRDYEPGRTTPGRLYLRAQVTIVRAWHGRVHATVTDHGAWRVTHKRGVWRCSCAAVQPCSHAAAVALVVDLPKGARHLPWATGVPA